MYIKSLRNFKSMPSLIKPQANCKSNQSFTYLRHILITRCQTKNFNIRASLCDIFYSFVTWTIYTFTYITCCHINLIPPFWNVIERFRYIIPPFCQIIPNFIRMNDRYTIYRWFLYTIFSTDMSTNAFTNYWTRPNFHL